MKNPLNYPQTYVHLKKMDDEAKRYGAIRTWEVEEKGRGVAGGDVGSRER